MTKHQFTNRVALSSGIRRSFTRCKLRFFASFDSLALSLRVSLWLLLPLVVAPCVNVLGNVIQRYLMYLIDDLTVYAVQQSHPPIRELTEDLYK